MKRCVTGMRLSAAAFLGAMIVFPAGANGGEFATDETGVTAHAASSDSSQPAVGPLRPPQTSHETTVPAPGGMPEIFKMVDAGLSKEVIKAVIERASLPFDPTPTDLIALKQRGVSDEIALALLKHEPAASPGGGKTSTAELAPSNKRVVLVYIDPEGYDYFQHYYLYPRTLAAANARLGWYQTPFGYGYCPP